MCIIIDANCGAKLAKGDATAAPVAKWLASPLGHVATGGSKLGSEYAKLPNLLKFLLELQRSGKVRRYASLQVDSMQQQLEEAASLKSDDPHIIALALVSGARIIFSNDKDLHNDFSNPNILKPKGHIYQDQSHARLLATAIPCLIPV